MPLRTQRGNYRFLFFCSNIKNCHFDNIFPHCALESCLLRAIFIFCKSGAKLMFFPTVSSSICANRFGPHNFTQRSLWIRAKNQFSKYAGNFNLWMLNPRPCKTHTLGKKNASIMYFFFCSDISILLKDDTIEFFHALEKSLDIPT